MPDDRSQPTVTHKAPPRRWATSEQKEAWKAHHAEVLALFESSMSVKEISRLFGRSGTTVNDWLLKAKVEAMANMQEDAP